MRSHSRLVVGVPLGGMPLGRSAPERELLNAPIWGFCSAQRLLDVGYEQLFL